MFSDPADKGEYKGDVEGIREANMEDPQRKIHEGPPAVRAATATRT